MTQSGGRQTPRLIRQTLRHFCASLCLSGDRPVYSLLTLIKRWPGGRMASRVPFPPSLPVPAEPIRGRLFFMVASRETAGHQLPRGCSDALPVVAFARRTCFARSLAAFFSWLYSASWFPRYGETQQTLRVISTNPVLQTNNYPSRTSLRLEDLIEITEKIQTSWWTFSFFITRN